jgi:predicted nucleotidyltransferase
MSSTRLLNATEILALLAQKKQTIAGAYGLRELGLFGSYADGYASSESDIDLLVDIERG